MFAFSFFASTPQSLSLVVCAVSIAGNGAISDSGLESAEQADQSHRYVSSSDLTGIVHADAWLLV